MKRETRNLVLYAGLWVMLLWGMVVRDWWLFVPAAFLILLEHMDPMR